MQKLLILALASATITLAEPPSISGIYPSLATFNDEGECGTGAVVPWADRLWVISYAPHMPKGSSDKLYEITPDLKQIIRPESVGGTPANRMIHRESQQLFIGPYVIDAKGKVRVITPQQMFGRHTGMARHLTDPANKICYATMEEGMYEVDVHALAVKELWTDEQKKGERKADLPGYHGKGFYSGQGRYVYANNGDHAKEALSNPSVPSGVLAEWDGKADQWTIVRRNQFTDVTGPGGIEGNAKDDDPLWSIGWDHRSLILMCLDHGEWHAFRLPKASHSYDGAHGWNTEWPRIRDIGEDSLLMTMHGSFWKFPKTFNASNTAGIVPRSNYLKIVGDFCRWQDRIVLGCDDTAKSEFLNKDLIKGTLAGPGQSQSNLWFIKPEQLDQFGPAIGRGAVWMNEDVKANEPSDPFLVSGFRYCSLWLQGDPLALSQPSLVKVEVDVAGDGKWTSVKDLNVSKKGAWYDLSDLSSTWVRLTSNVPLTPGTAFFHLRNADTRSSNAAPIFNGIASPTSKDVSKGLIMARGAGKKTLRFVTEDLHCYDLDADLKLVKADDPKGAAWTANAVALAKRVVTIDNASVLYVDSKGQRWRLPKGDPAFATAGHHRMGREVCTERNLLNLYGTFYEMPANNAGGFAKVRPICTHNRFIHDYTSYRGMLIMTGIEAEAEGEHIIRSDDGKVAVWAGVVDDLWQFGKARGVGGPWFESKVKADKPSDAYLVTGYDKKRAVLSHTSTEPVKFRIEADFTCNGDWREVTTLEVKPGEKLEHKFPNAFGAYWLRVVADRDTTATTTFFWE